MPPSSGEAPALDALLAPLRDDPGSSAVLCDVDGTLAPIVQRASDARVPAETADLLGSLARRYALVGCVSGRPAAEVRELVGRGELAYIGNHGYERLLPGDREPSADPALRGHEDAAARFLDDDAVRAQLDAAELRPEDKGPIRALHWRGASDERAAELRARELATRAQESGLVAHWGRKVLELRPPLERSRPAARRIDRRGALRRRRPHRRRRISPPARDGGVGRAPRGRVHRGRVERGPARGDRRGGRGG
jgi:trehalose-6-phosphatase